MKANKLILLGLVSVATIFGGCSKKEDAPAENKPDYNALLTGKNWMMTTWIVTVQGQAPLDRYANMQACEKDDLTEFKTDKTVWSKPGDTKCDPSEADQELMGTWSLTNGDTKLQMVYGDTLLFDLVKCDGAVLQLKRTSIDPMTTVSQVEEMNFAKK